MSSMTTLVIDIENEIIQGTLSMEEIAKKFNVPVHWVWETAQRIDLDYDDNSPY